MTERERIQMQIGEVPATVVAAAPLSRALFSPGGLFDRPAADEQERRAVAQSELFVRARRRLTELQRAEAAEFARRVADIPQGTIARLETAR
jgi:hypothetical protein